MSRLLTGLKAHLWQRLSALWLLVYFPLAGLYLANQTITHHAQLMIVLAQPLFWVTTLITLGLIAVHAWVGVRDILLDYLPRPRVGAALLALGTGLGVWLGFAIYTAWSVLVQA
ncbi:MAG: succinate dehydrogenase, hydrophobic membrane anchor protein [Hydrogenovibrio sp.]|uniref:succinate dehydrogenase, hydrophobic membrane anchor protein n=1 Tax=Hydrogenovibrio sp. TaxID=2065821 RepID=UPI00286FC6E0|nr:succinate dehydrogenase, hydrophobic membrane anchor protein [Hydrogenovibrio sp.]MDR9498827.1 succinate dehydrogenase, hydrophobic membrane anchor protein [Hydrogenovibrio sp.]